MASDNKTEPATPRRRAEARKRGQVARSTELTSVAVLFASLLVLNARAGETLTQYCAVAREAFLQTGGLHEQPEALLALTGDLVVSSLMALAPLVAAATIAGVSVNVMQVGPMFSLEVLKPDINKLNPISGIKRLCSGQILVELAKAAAKAGVMGFIAYQVVRERYWVVVGLQSATAEGTLAGLGSMMLEIAQKCGLALLVMAVADFAYQRRSHEARLKMSRDEIKEEVRQGEGDPHVKGKIRQLQRRFASRRMMQAVPNADVVVTNPTHYAVAIEYKPPLMQAPVVTAKGQLLLAAEIKRVASEHGVPVVENPPLARALYRSVEVGSAIPPALYQAVAEVLAFIYRLRQQSEASRKAAAETTSLTERETPWL